MNPLLGFVHEGKRNDEEEGPRKRSTKKFNEKGVEWFEERNDITQHGAQKSVSFKDLLLGSMLV